MNGNIVSQYIDQTGTEIIVLEFRPPYADAVVRIESQWEKIAGGGVRAWYTRSQFDDCVMLADGLREPEYA